MASERIFTEDEQQEFEALAQRRGFSSLRGYMRALIKQDAEQHGEAVEIDDDLIDPVEGFMEGWADAREGRVISHEEFVRRMNEDAD
jgi:hypothetical protein